MTGATPDARQDHGAGRRNGDTYLITPEELEKFRRDGYVHLRGVMTAAEMDEIEHVYDRFLRGKIAVEGKDFNDMTTGEHGTDPSGYAVVNVMLPRRYFPGWQGNLFERRAQSIADQLCGEGMTIDFDQLLAKSPGRPDAIFHWHQDQAYWIDTDDRRTATCWLAVDGGLSSGRASAGPGIAAAKASRRPDSMAVRRFIPVSALSKNAPPRCRLRALMRRYHQIINGDGAGAAGNGPR